LKLAKDTQIAFEVNQEMISVSSDQEVVRHPMFLSLKPASFIAEAEGGFCFPILLWLSSSRGRGHLDWKHSTRRNTSAGMVHILLNFNINWCKRFLASTSSWSHTLHSFLPRWNILGVDSSCQVGLLRKGKVMPTMRVSNIGKWPK
jgi:hypothetical protein